jgi:MFS family permease
MPAPPDRPSEAYARYVLGLLVVVYVLNFLDRQILSILAERIKADLGLRDDQIGFLYGTAFAVFYALFGIPLGRLADVWVRTRLIALGLAVWSLMTSASAFARNFVELSGARIGVGIGEASANPSAYSLLSDYFPPARRATVLAIYSSGIYIGAGLGLGIGGLIVQRWDAAFAGGVSPLGLHGWQSRFSRSACRVCCSPLRRPARAATRAAMARRAASRLAARGAVPELGAVLPPLTLVTLARLGGLPAVAANLGVAAGVALVVVALIALVGSPAQWIALGVGVYAVLSWTQALRRRDPRSHAAIFSQPTLRYAAVGFALLAFTGYGVGFWVPPYFVRQRGVSEAEAGLILGGTAAAAGWLGVTLGGLWSDRWRRTAEGARFYVGMVAAILPLPFLVWMLRSESNTTAYALNVLVGISTSMWIGPSAAMVQDLVPARLRGTASAAYLS